MATIIPTNMLTTSATGSGSPGSNKFTTTSLCTILSTLCLLTAFFDIYLLDMARILFVSSLATADIDVNDLSVVALKSFGCRKRQMLTMIPASSGPNAGCAGKTATATSKAIDFSADGNIQAAGKTDIRQAARQGSRHAVPGVLELPSGGYQCAVMSTYSLAFTCADLTLLSSFPLIADGSEKTGFSESALSMFLSGLGLRLREYRVGGLGRGTLPFSALLIIINVMYLD
ncbi:hypothetical protein P154DRAFT_570897 [Amniculicola lignicola CBS 123094]|uniref:Uncharacterized protein n=1 Tax=Amniculicola lignicola CBS 123094 TaxID=1392246 RepID=A0A6A5X2J9_9PLEO|nr:hypothetical protein P154DRAFT_570897 [Amniculicola lignicola CBS 123094]